MAYVNENIVDTTEVDKIVAKLEQEGYSDPELIRFKIDMVAFLNFLRSNLEKELDQVNELDVHAFKEYITTDVVFQEMIQRRMRHVQLGLEIAKELQN